MFAGCIGASAELTLDESGPVASHQSEIALADLDSSLTSRLRQLKAERKRPAHIRAASDAPDHHPNAGATTARP